jgi:hypothetical protein
MERPIQLGGGCVRRLKTRNQGSSLAEGVFLPVPAGMAARLERPEPRTPAASHLAVSGDNGKGFTMVVFVQI